MTVDFQQELASLLNTHSAENASNTPDWLLAQFMLACLSAFNAAVQQRENWYGRDPRPTLDPTQAGVFTNNVGAPDGSLVAHDE